MTKIEHCKKSGHDIYHGPRQRVCRTCDNKRTLTRYHLDGGYKKYHRDWAFKMYQIRKNIIDKAKDKPCADCRVKYEPFIMQLDHREGTKKEFTIGQTGRIKTVDTLLREIEKCEVVCANCHARRTHFNLPKIIARKNKFKRYNSIYITPK
jgi:hypothetical protein